MAKSTTKKSNRGSGRPSPDWAGDRSSLHRRIRSMSPTSRRKIRKVIAWALALVVTIPTVVLGMGTLEHRIFGPGRAGGISRIHVRLPSRPAWMPDALARQIAASCIVPDVGFHATNLTVEVFRKVKANPWVAKVHWVRKSVCDDEMTGVVEVYCTYRKPVAKVLFSDELASMSQKEIYVDAEGVRLPAAQTPKFLARLPIGRTDETRTKTYAYFEAIPKRAKVFDVHYPVIRAVASDPPPAGQPWRSDDLAAALRLLAMIVDKPYYDQITVVDVRNFDGRVAPNEPHLRLSAQIGRGRPTDIRFGRLPIPGGGDYVVSPQRKIAYLDSYAQQHDGQLGGLNDMIDLRYDQLHVSRN
ncbi:MAG TPA: hypothetical protein ENH80_07790 [Phycisphaerae bacterium]|nr:hypothetical protein [Phycisphaerae bacterium]HDZ43825.1 hypothetical protein [Phycisphaerae bacterium]